MADTRLRRLERAWQETGCREARKAYEMERKRLRLGRLVIRHYVAEHHHGHCGPDGLFDIEFDSVRPWTNTDKVFAACSVELWPRNLVAEARGWEQTMKKKIHYTEDPDEVTCKTCLRSINKAPDDAKRVRRHYAPGSRDGAKPPVCGRDDSEKFDERFEWTMQGVNCPACKRVMKMGRRAPRSPRVGAR